MEQLEAILAVCRLTHYSSDSVSDTSGAGTSERASPEKWKDEDLGWFPNPSPSSSSNKSILYQNPVQNCCQNIGESGHGLRETITLGGTI